MTEESVAGGDEAHADQPDDVVLSSGSRMADDPGARTPDGTDRLITVLVVDDDEAFLELTAMRLEATDERVSIVPTGDAESALDRLSEREIDCIVSDYQLPVMSGMDLLERVRARHPQVPFVLFTGRGSEEVAGRAISVGVTDYLQKGGPEQFDRLGNRVVHASEAFQSRRAAERVQTHFRSVVGNSTDAIVTIDESGTVRFANSAVESVFGHRPEEVVGNAVTMLMPERLRPDHEAGLARYLETRERRQNWRGMEVPGLHADGTEIPLSISFGEFERGGQQHFTAVIRDRSPLEAHRQALADERAFAESILDSIDELLVVLDRDGRLLRWNDRVEEVTGLAPGDLDGIPVVDLFDAPTGDRIATALATVLETGEATVEVDVEVGGPGDVIGAGDESPPPTVPVEFRCRHLTDDEGHFLGICAVGRDVSDQRSLEAELRASTERYRTLVEQNLVGIYVVRDDRIEYANRRIANLLGYDREELEGMAPERLVADRATAQSVPAIARAVLAEEREELHETLRLESRDGTLLDVETQATRIDLVDGPALLGTMVDVTGRKERQLRLQVLNRVLRHNLRTDVNVLLGRTELAGDVSDHPAVTEHLDIVGRVGQRLLERSEQAREIEQTLGESAADNQPVDVADLARSVAADFARKYPHADIAVDLPEAYWVAANREFEFALRELVTNAVVHSDRSEPRVTVTVPDASAGVGSKRRLLVVADDGPGLPDSERRVLAAGEETPLEHGSGMGLWLVYWIVRTSGGNLSFADDGGRGTRVVLGLPAVDPATDAGDD